MTHARTQHPNAALTPRQRHKMVALVIDDGWTIEATAERFQVDAKTVTKWRDRFRDQGPDGLFDGDTSLDVESTGRPLRWYRLIEEAGVGAFAIVWRGIQPSVNREVAIKQIRSELATQPDFIRRFEAEAHLVARIEHPHIVPLIDFWRDPDSAYLVMRWLPGGTLEKRLDDGPLSLSETLVLAHQVGGALSAAHAHGIIHRDVKTGNILFDGSGHAFLGDFGIALEATESAGPVAALSPGSPAYSAPEQIRREPLGPEADVFSLGVVVFECLTGSLPFAAMSALDLVERGGWVVPTNGSPRRWCPGPTRSKRWRRHFFGSR